MYTTVLQYAWHVHNNDEKVAGVNLKYLVHWIDDLGSLDSGGGGAAKQGSLHNCAKD